MEVSPEVGLIIEIDSDSCHLDSLAVRILDRHGIKVFGRKSSLGQANDRSTLVKKVALRVEIAVRESGFNGNNQSYRCQFYPGIPA